MTRLLKILTVFAGLALVAMPAQAYEKGDWIVRGGVGLVSPDDGFIDQTNNASVDDGVSAVISGTYMFDSNWGFEVLAAFPFSHDIGDPDVGDFAEVKHLPPTFSLVYQFAPDADFRPYVGAGLNYTLFFDEEVDQSILPDVGLSVEDTFGFAAHVGADLKVADNWMVNLEIRYIQIEPDLELLVNGVPVVTIPEHEINPMVYSLNLVWVF